MTGAAIPAGAAYELDRAPQVCVYPAHPRTWLHDVVGRLVGQTVPLEQAEALVWTSATPAGLDEVLARAPRLRWVQLPWSGVEHFVPTIERTLATYQWSTAGGIYAEPVAEHALGLTLALLRGLPRYARADTWQERGGRSLRGSEVVVVGAGAISHELVRLLGGWFECAVTVVRRSDRPVRGPGVVRRVRYPQLSSVLPAADVVIVAAPSSEATRGIIHAGALARMKPTAVLVNVARGDLVVTDDLVAALDRGGIAGAALDVTEPEPLPDDHPLWGHPRCLITPHTACPDADAMVAFERFFADNLRRYLAGAELRGRYQLDQ